MEAPRFEIGKVLKLDGRLVRVEEVELGWIYILDTGEFAFEHELKEPNMIQGWTYRCPGEEFGEHGVYKNKDEAIREGRSTCRDYGYYLIAKVVAFPAGTKLSGISEQIYITNDI